MKIKTNCVYPPIPDRRFDYSAVDDDTYDGPGCPIGTGATENAAVRDLIDQLKEEDESAALDKALADWLAERHTPRRAIPMSVITGLKFLAVTVVVVITALALGTGFELLAARYPVVLL